MRGMARGGHFNVDRALLDRLPKLEIIANSASVTTASTSSAAPSAASSSPTRRTC
jgi:hypothetical protein